MTSEITNRYQCFNKQVDAFELQKKSNGKRCLSVEFPFLTETGNGLRRFIIDDLMDFWYWYRYQYSGGRHFYELIQEGYPCRLYFDLEYQKAENKDIVLNQILNDFINLTNQMVDELYGLKITKKNWMLLESTTETKVSAHASVHFPGNLLFPSNVAMRTFIQALTQRMSDTGIGIVKKGSEETFICDPAVYTKNRCFRLYWSSKAGKTAVLKLMKGCTFYENLPKEEYDVFIDTLVIPINYKDCPKLNIQENPGLVLKQTRINGPSRSKTIADHYAKRTEMSPPMISNNRRFVRNVEIIQTSSGHSPLVELDEYIVEFNKQFVPDVTIRQWSLMVIPGTASRRMQYQFVNCRYCLHMQREHKSQNVYWTIVLDQMVMFQRCFDCRDFVSSHFPLPADLVEKIAPKIDGVFDNKVDIKTLNSETYNNCLNDSIHSLDLKEYSLLVGYDSDSEVEYIDSKNMDSFYDSSIDRKFEAVEEKKKKQKDVAVTTVGSDVDSFYDLSIDRKFEAVEEKKKGQMDAFVTTVDSKNMDSFYDSAIDRKFEAVEEKRKRQIDALGSSQKVKTRVNSSQRTITNFGLMKTKTNEPMVVDLTCEIEQTVSQTFQNPRKRKGVDALKNVKRGKV